MTKKLEELLYLPDSKEIIKQDQKKERKDVVAQQNETLRDIAEFDKISAAGGTSFFTTLDALDRCER